MIVYKMVVTLFKARHVKRSESLHNKNPSKL